MLEKYSFKNRKSISCGSKLPIGSQARLVVPLESKSREIFLEGFGGIKC
jgi:hypothetical protein